MTSRSKDNQTMKFGQLIEYKWELFLLKNHTQNMVEKLFPDPLLKNQNWTYLWTWSSIISIIRIISIIIISLKFYTLCFIVCQVEGYQHILKLSCKPLAFTSYKAYLKNKKRPGTSLPASVSVAYSIHWPNFIVWFSLICEILDNICIVIVCEPGCDVINF